MAKLPETLAQHGLWMLCLKPLLEKHFKLFVLYLGFGYKELRKVEDEVGFNSQLIYELCDSPCLLFYRLESCDSQ